MPRSTRRDLIVNGGLALGGVLSAAGIVWVVAPAQEVRSQEAVDEAKEEKARSEAPLSVVTAYRPRPDDPFGWVFPHPLTAAQLKRLKDDPDAYAPGNWAAAAGGVWIAAPDHAPEATGYSRVRITLRGKALRPVLVTSMQARVTRHPPLSGALVFAGAQGGGPLIEVGFNLDERDPVARDRTDDGVAFAKPYLDSHQLFVEHDEVVELDVVACSAKHYCEWDILLTLDVDGQRTELVVDAGGGPFRTSAFAPRYESRHLAIIDYPGGWRDWGPGTWPE